MGLSGLAHGMDYVVSMEASSAPMIIMTVFIPPTFHHARFSVSWKIKMVFCGLRPSTANSTCSIKRHESFHAVYDDVKEYSENIQIIKIQTTEDGDVLLLTKDKSLLRAYTDKEGKITMKQLHDSRPNVNVYDMRLKHNVFCETAEFINWIGMDYQILSLRKGAALKDKPC